jgi:large subunit ribosomal protein L20
MPRVKSGRTKLARRKKIFKISKGYTGSRRSLYRTAKEQVMKSLKYSYRDRKVRKREFRKLWIQRINAACKLNGTKYSQLVHGLQLAKVEVNRKVLADIAVRNSDVFSSICQVAQKAIKKASK